MGYGMLGVAGVTVMQTTPAVLMICSFGVNLQRELKYARTR